MEQASSQRGKKERGQGRGEGVVFGGAVLNQPEGIVPV